MVLSGASYLDLLASIEELSPVENLALTLASAENIEQFSPPVFAAFCSQNGLACIRRLQQFKPLIGPIRYQVETNEGRTTVTIEAESEDLVLPQLVVEGELVFLVHVIRSATKRNIVPLEIGSPRALQTATVEALGTPPLVPSSLQGSNTFKSSDLRVPFISRNDQIWSYFEPELSRRLHQVEKSASMSERVRSILLELLPAREGNIADVAKALSVSARSLQRQLEKEGTSFRAIRDNLRFQLAKEYLSTGDLNMDAIAFLLGYLEVNSFVRAFTGWAGESPSSFRKKFR